MRKPGTLGFKKFGPGKALKYESLTNLPTDRSRCLRCLRIKNLKTAQVLKNYVISNPFLPSNVTKVDAHEKDLCKIIVFKNSKNQDLLGNMKHR